MISRPWSARSEPRAVYRHRAAVSTAKADYAREIVLKNQRSERKLPVAPAITATTSAPDNACAVSVRMQQLALPLPEDAHVGRRDLNPHDVIFRKAVTLTDMRHIDEDVLATSLQGITDRRS